MTSSPSPDFSFSKDPPGSVSLGLTLLKQLGTKNAVISPGGLHLALRLAAAGTSEGSESAKQLAKILGEGDGGTKIAADSSVMAMATAVFASSRMRLEYQAKAQPEFAAYASELPTSIDPINSWVRHDMNGKICQLISSVPQSDDALLLYAVHFSAPWKAPFNKNNTVSSVFFADNGQEGVQMMVLHNHVGLYAEAHVEDQRVRLFSMLYGGDGELNAVMIVPFHDSDIDSVLNALCASSGSSNWGKLLASMKPTEMACIAIPRFKLECSGGLKESLTQMGLTAPSSGDAFPAMAENVAIHEVVHKAYLECTEKGTDPSAASVIHILRCGFIARPTIVCDRPFLFAVTCGDDLSLICRVDQVVDPN